jgi:hypothetical protein
MTKQEVIAAITELAMAKRRPRTQYECCLIGARASVAVGDVPTTDEEFLSAAWGQASGLFGPAFERADYDQKVAWIDMCDRALREAAGAPMGE